jgi:hypothetical protein
MRRHVAKHLYTFTIGGSYVLETKALASTSEVGRALLVEAFKRSRS